MSVSAASGSGPVRPVRILSVSELVPVMVRFLGPIRGLLTHWNRGRSWPCAGESSCPISLHRARQIWKGYAAAEAWIPSEECWAPCVCEATENLEHQLRGRKLRGEVWLLSRESEGREVKSVVGLYCETFPAESLRPAFDVATVLKRFYHETNLVLDVPNPVPPKLCLEPIADRPPSLPPELTVSNAETKQLSAEEAESFRKRLMEAGLLRPRRDDRKGHGNGQDAEKNGQKAREK